MNKAIIGIAGIIWLLSDLALAAQDNETKLIRPCVTLTGDDSQVSERGFHRIRSLDDWAKVWQQHTGQNKVKHNSFRDNHYDDFYNPLNLPLVDFDHYMVIAIFQGTSWNSAGLNAVSISEEVGVINFRFEDKPYSTEGPNGGGKKVNVYGFFVMPRSTKAVILEERVFRMNQEKLEDAVKPKKQFDNLADALYQFDKTKLSTTSWEQRIKFPEAK